METCDRGKPDARRRAEADQRAATRRICCGHRIDPAVTSEQERIPQESSVNNETPSRPTSPVRLSTAASLTADASDEPVLHLAKLLTHSECQPDASTAGRSAGAGHAGGQSRGGPHAA